MRFIDISDYQDGIDLWRYPWPVISTKASEGRNWRSKTFLRWRDIISERGIYNLIYHYLRANPTDSEVENFLGAIGGELRPNEIHVCDYEAAEAGMALVALGDKDVIPELGTPMGRGARMEADFRRDTLATLSNINTLAQEYGDGWLAGTNQELGKLGGLYSFTSYLQARATDQLTKYWLWIANYGRNDGNPGSFPGTDRWQRFEAGPGEWPYSGRTPFWQFSDQGRVDFYNGRLDINESLMTVEQIAQLCGKKKGQGTVQGLNIININSQMTMDLAGAPSEAGIGWAIGQSPGDAGLDQLFHIQWTGVEREVGGRKDHECVIKHAQSGLVLDIEGSSKEAGAKAVLWDWHGGPNQRYWAIGVGPGLVAFQSVHSGLVLAVENGRKDVDAPIIQAYGNGALDQMWTTGLVNARPFV